MNLKKTVYLCLTVILVSLLMLILHSYLELWYIDAIYASSGVYPQPTVFLRLSSYLPPAVPYILIVVSVAGGLLLGRWWWRIVYVEKRHWRLKKRRRGK